jgi:hypothetical protein
MKVINLIKASEKKECSEELHVFTIVRGVGHYFGMPIWICKKCKKKVFAS